MFESTEIIVGANVQCTCQPSRTLAEIHYGDTPRPVPEEGDKESQLELKFDDNEHRDSTTEKPKRRSPGEVNKIACDTVVEMLDMGWDLREIYPSDIVKHAKLYFGEDVSDSTVGDTGIYFIIRTTKERALANRKARAY